MYLMCLWQCELQVKALPLAWLGCWHIQPNSTIMRERFHWWGSRKCGGQVIISMHEQETSVWQKFAIGRVVASKQERKLVKKNCMMVWASFAGYTGVPSSSMFNLRASLSNVWSGCRIMEEIGWTPFAALAALCSCVHPEMRKNQINLLTLKSQATAHDQHRQERETR